MPNIEGVQIIPLRKIPDERGMVMHMLRADAPHFQQFGEVYFSCVYPGVVKGWHLHSRMTINYACPIGMIKLALYDARPNSPTRGQIQEIFMGENNYVLAIVPAGVWNGFKGISEKMALVCNCATIPHDPTEITRLDPHKNDIPYDWSRKDG
jgi:dTDP-4-dehydrorhamnose 3,5-epimerase